MSEIARKITKQMLDAVKLAEPVAPVERWKLEMMIEREMHRDDIIEVLTCLTNDNDFCDVDTEKLLKLLQS